MEQLTTNIGKILTKYNEESDSFDMIRIMHLKDDMIEYCLLNEDYSINYNESIECKVKEFTDKFKDWKTLSPNGILSLSNVKVATNQSGSEIKDIVMLFFTENKVLHIFDPCTPCIVARQAINNIYKMEFNADENDVGVSVTDDTIPQGFTFMDFTESETIYNSLLTCVYRTDTPESLAELLDNDDTTNILENLYNTAIGDNIKFNGSIKNDCYHGYCNSLLSFIIHSGLMNDIYSKMGVIKVDFVLEFNKPIEGEDKILLSTLCGGINIVKAVPIKFGYDINISIIKMKYMLVMDKNNILWIVPFTSTVDEFSPLEFYKITSEQTNKIQERLKKCIDMCDSINS